VREQQLRFVGDPAAAGGDLEALAAIAVEVDVAVMVAAGVPRFAPHPHPGVRPGGDLHDRRDRERRLEFEGASDRQRERVLGGGWGGTHRTDHRSLSA
jgi:hypothetical protein